MDIENLIAAASRAQLEDENNIGNCSRIWHLGVFFDGVHRNIEQDAPERRLSNVARLFRAYPDVMNNTTMESHSKFYIAGLGTPFKEEMTARLHTMMDGAQNTTLDDIKAQPGDIAKETGVELLKGKNWYEVLKKQGEKLLNPAEYKKLIGNISSSVAKKVSIEATPWLRDNPTVADFLVTGADTRLASTKISFEEAFKEVKTLSPVPVRLISVAVFGYDLGATLARKFIDDLLGEVCQKQGESYSYQGVPVDIVFTGLFDCARHTPASNDNGVDYFIAAAGGPLSKLSVLFGDKSIDHQTALPKAVRSALHLVAAHERRPWRCLYRLGDTSPEHEEELLPGCSEDIGGGLKPDEQKPSAELCRVALQKMYRAAAMAGVPFPNFKTLKQYSETVASYFVMEDTWENASVAEWVARYQKVMRAKKVSILAQNQHLDNYIDWLGQQYYQYRTEHLKLSGQRERALSGPGAMMGQLGIEKNALREARGIQLQIDTLEQHWGWLEDVHEAAKTARGWGDGVNIMDKRIDLAPDIYVPAVKRADNFLRYAQSAFTGEPISIMPTRDTAVLYARFMHDIQRADRGAAISADYLVIRSMEKPGG
jgi:hypothetical protein